MRYICDHDLHIHSNRSACVRNDPEQTPERMLRYAKENGFRTVCVTDHFWDEDIPCISDWHRQHTFKRISSVVPLPQEENIRFLFGCETDLDKNDILGISRERMEVFDFIIIPTTHMGGGFAVPQEYGDNPSAKAEHWVRRLDAVLHMDLPFHKIGIAHLAYPQMIKPRENYLKMLSMIASADMERLFTRAAALGCGIELNASDMSFSEEEAEYVLRPFRIAKGCGCRFYCGSDAHHSPRFELAKGLFEKAVTLLELKEEDKFYPG